ncbi:MAG: hypothetical protein N3C12_12075 [Candidatus Binatia bacterium]|nr:hypothetical protein [Candidatus Binatia bacterium]
MALSDVKERRFLARVWLGFSFLAAAVGVFNVVVRLRVADLGYRIEATHRAIERLELERRELQVRAARAEDARRLEQLAKSRLGLGPASASQRMVVP